VIYALREAYRLEELEYRPPNHDSNAGALAKRALYLDLSHPNLRPLSRIAREPTRLA
jgi:hypothetical protein